VTDSEIVCWIVEKFEGSAATNDPDDRGKITRFGVTLPTLQQIRPEATAGDVWALTKEDAIDLYLELFVFRPGFHQIVDWRLRLLVVDSGIHSGVRRATEWLQAAVGAQVDGHAGRDTYGRVAAADPVKTRERVMAARLRHIGGLIARDVRQAKFTRGWLGRIATLLEAA
jgi:lysozyme family protein